MLFDLASWSVLIPMAFAAGRGALALLGAVHLRAGDRFLAATWLGIVLLSLSLLAVSLVAPLTIGLTLTVGMTLAATGLAIAGVSRPAPSRRRPHTDHGTPWWAVAIGVSLIGVGAAALASDPVTLYDSLVYHLGVVQWLHEHGTVRGIALIHNRLGHISAWFTLGAGLSVDPVAARTATVPLGLALVLVGVQGSVACGRIACRRALGADWFLALSSAALIWAVLMYNAATPSPDVAANALIVVVAWAMLVVPRAGSLVRTHGWRRWLGPRLIPFVLAVGACTMKLFALPAALVAAVFYVFARADDRGARDAAVRAAVCAAVGAVLMAPFVAANLLASGCPLFPSPIGCLTTSWSIGVDRASDYTAYVRDVARWESRYSASRASDLPWIGQWVAAHPVVTTLAVLAPLLAPPLLQGPRRDGLRSALLLAVCGITFVAWQAPAPRFLYAFVIIVPALAVAFPLASVSSRSLRSVIDRSSAPSASAGFLAAAVVASLAFAVASQKLNVRSALTSRAAFLPRRSSLVLPESPAPPGRLYQWRVNDVAVVTPVPRPIADTLGYRSTIDGDAGFEKCSTAPLPCTPYLPSADVRLRLPERGLSAGFVRGVTDPSASTAAMRCVGELDAASRSMLSLGATTPQTSASSMCGGPGGRF